MNLPTILDVAIGLVFIFFVFSLFVSGIVELLNTFNERRASLFRNAINELLGKNLGTLFFGHKLNRVKEQGKRPISYLSADSFSTVLIDLIVREKTADGAGVSGSAPASPADTLSDIRSAMSRVSLNDIKDLIEPMLEKSGDFQTFKEELERWYNSYMEQVSGWYKRNAVVFVRVVAAVVAVGLNVDTVYLTNRLSHDDGLRQRVVAAATRTAQTDTGRLGLKDPAFITYLEDRESTLIDTATHIISTTLTASDSLKLQSAYVQFAKEQIDELQLPIGWSKPPGGTIWTWQRLPGQSMLSAFIGWILTAAALSFGAPFWFDLLLKLVNIRNMPRRPAGNPDPAKP